MKPTHKTLAAYQKSYELAMKIFHISKKFPPEEKYSLTDQIRRSSRSVCVNIGEAYRKKKYPKDFECKLSISDAELGETQIWLDFARDCGYLTAEEVDPLLSLADEGGRLIGYMINNPGKFGVGKS